MTSPLPYIPPARPWYRRTAVVVSAIVIGAIIVISAVGAALGANNKGTTDSSNAAAAVQTQPSTAPAPHTHHARAKAIQRPPQPQPPRHSGRSRSQTAPARDGSWIMPNELGKDLQSAQDDVQRVSGDPIFFSHSHDLLGDRFQILDSDWQVCTQNVVPGQRVGALAHIDFGVVKVYESCP